MHTNWLPIVINISVPLRPVYQQASHVFTTLRKTFLIAVTRRKALCHRCPPYAMQCNAVCQACVMATAGMLAQGWEVDLPTPKAHLVLCIVIPITPTTLLQLSHHACTHSHILISSFMSRFETQSILFVQVSVSKSSTSKVATLHQCCIAHQLMSNTCTGLNMETSCGKYVSQCE